MTREETKETDSTTPDSRDILPLKGGCAIQHSGVQQMQKKISMKGCIKHLVQIKRRTIS